MVMRLVQVRLPEGLIEEIERLVECGLYGNKSDAVREGIRRLIVDTHRHTRSMPRKEASDPPRSHII